MNSEQLRLLAPRLRDYLDRRDMAASHGQVLDLLAALPGLRNWPEVKAFPQRLEARAFDLDAMARLMRRIATAFPSQWEVLQALPARRRPTPEALMDGLAPWTVESPRDPARRERLILASGSSSPGCLMTAGIADRVESALQRFVWGPVPAGADDPANFHEAWLAACDSDPLTSDQPEYWQREPAGDLGNISDWSRHLPMLQDYERLELWMDPDPNAQLQLLQMLAWLGRQPGLLNKLFIVHPANRKPWSERRPSEVRAMDPQAAQVCAAEIELATRAWDARRAPTPQAWVALLSEDLSALPGLRSCVLAMLDELPALGSGLRATERLLLDAIAPGGVTPMRMMAALAREDLPGVFDYWELGRLLDGLARGPRPAVLGLDESPFDLALHDDAERHRRYRQSKLELSPFGHALLKGEADFVATGGLRRWWGGTRLSAENLWRWDAAKQELHAP